MNLTDVNATDVAGFAEYTDKDADTEELALFFKTLVKVARRHWLLIAAIIAGALVIGTVVTFLMTPEYNASSQVMIEERADQIIEGTDLQQQASGLDEDRFLQTQLGIISSRSLARNVVQSGRFDRDTAFFESMGAELPAENGLGDKKSATKPQEIAVALLTKNLEVKLPTDSRIAEITIKSRDPQLAAEIANLYAQRYIEYNLNQKFESSSYARQFLQQQLEEARVKLTRSEQELNQYARAAGLIRVTTTGDGQSQESALSVTNSTLISLTDAAARATADRITAQDRWEVMSKQPVLSVPEVNSNSAVQQLLGQKAQIQGDLAEERSRHLDQYSTVKSKMAEIADLDSRINAIANSIRHSTELEYKSALEKEKSLLVRVSELRANALMEQDRGVQYNVLKRVADTNRTLYESLLSRFNELSASAGSVSNNVTLVDAADVPTVPSSPNLWLNLALALMAGIVIAGVVIVAIEVFNDTIRTPQDVENKLGMRLLGLIPVQEEGDIAAKLANRQSSMSEAYRSLLTNLRYTTAHGLPQVLVITSARESEGKSTTARAIAQDAAQLGKKVLLVDADLRRPTLHRLMGDGEKSGLTEVLVGQKTVDEVIRSTAISNLYYLNALPIPPDPALILAGDGLAQFFVAVRNQFDMIVVDCPPLLGIADAPILATHADGLLFVIDASSFHRGAVKSALRRLTLINAPILGVVLNRFKPTVGDDDYSYYTYNYYNYRTEDE